VEEMFLPMTSVVVTPALPTGESAFGFVAVNKGRIVRVGDPPRTHETPQQVTRKSRPPKAKTARK
jgi:hypothetical protein